MSRQPLLASLLLVAALAGAATAQCTVNGVTFTSYGVGCATVFGNAPSLSGAFNASACTVTYTVNDFSGCCNTFLQVRFLVFGVQQISQALPWIGPGCNLLVTPDVIIQAPASAGNQFTFTLPPGIPPLTVHAQAADQYFTTIGFTTDFQVTNGLTTTIF